MQTNNAQLSEQPELDRITIVLRPQEISSLEQIRKYIQIGAPVAIGRGIAVISAFSDRDDSDALHQLESQLVLAETAMRRGALLRDQDHVPALRRVIEHIPSLYLAVSDSVKESALEDGDDQGMAEEAAGQAIRVMVTLKQKLEKLLEPDLLTAIPVPVSEPIPVVAESPYAQVRVTNIDEWIKTVKNAQRYELLRDRKRVTDGNDLVVTRGSLIFHGDALDCEVDDGLRLARLLELHGDPL